MSDITVNVESDYVTLDTLEWFEATAENVSDYWRAIVARCARDDNDDNRSFYDSRAVSVRQSCDARDRVIASLGRRAEPIGWVVSDGICSGHTSNSDTNFETNFGYSAVDLYRGGWHHGVLIFVSLGDYADYGLDYVYLVNSWDDAMQVLSPEIGYYCGQCGEWADTRNGGYSFDANDGAERRDIITDSGVTCSNGHAVTLRARDSF